MAGPPNVVPRTLKAGGKLNVVFNVTFDCANDPLKGAGRQDFRSLAAVHAEALDGNADAEPADDVCPRIPSGSDKGCGAENIAGLLGGDVLTDVAIKP